MSVFPESLRAQAAALVEYCRSHQLTMATAESCTGGLIAGLLTEIPGASDVFTHGFVTYANAAKTRMLGVDAALIDAHGAVSKEVAIAMAQGALRTAQSALAVSVTGIAGPGGATPTKPVGLVHIAVADRNAPTRHAVHQFSGDRTAVRLAAVAGALSLIRS